MTPPFYRWRQRMSKRQRVRRRREVRWLAGMALRFRYEVAVIRAKGRRIVTAAPVAAKASCRRSLKAGR